MNERYNYQGKRYIALVRASDTTEGTTSTQAQLAMLHERAVTLKMSLVAEVILDGVTGSMPGKRAEAHIMVAFLGYCLQVTLRQKLQRHAPGLTPRQTLTSLRSIRMVDVHLPTTDGRTLILPRLTEPGAEQRMTLEKLGLTLPPQPPPRIRAAATAEAAAAGQAGEASVLM